MSIEDQKKKLLFIDYSYHSHTKSNLFFLELLYERYDVDIKYFNPESDDYNYFDSNHILSMYDILIFFQIIPPKKIKHKNIVFVPMLDNMMFRSIYRILHIRKYKTIYFSKFLQQKYRMLISNSIYIQYFPNTKFFIHGDNNKAFFWQRKNHITIDTVDTLFKNCNIKIHMHNAIDPDFALCKPSIEQEKKYNIEYSDWFKDHTDYENTMNACGIYIAPRKYEGIGMSFLEAMANGKLVIAPNTPTMNEYIVHRKNGILYDHKNLEPFPKKYFDDISSIQQEAFNYCVSGREHWLANTHKIINIIEMSHVTHICKLLFVPCYITVLLIRLFNLIKKIACIILPYGIVHSYKVSRMKIKKNDSKPSPSIKIKYIVRDLMPYAAIKKWYDSK